MIDENFSLLSKLSPIRATHNFLVLFISSLLILALSLDRQGKQLALDLKRELRK